VIQGKYETSSQLERMGVISGGDMTFESAITKSMHLNGIGMEGADFAHLFKKDLRGEITNTAPISTD
jgi:L-asparaginase